MVPYYTFGKGNICSKEYLKYGGNLGKSSEVTPLALDSTCARSRETPEFMKADSHIKNSNIGTQAQVNQVHALICSNTK